MHNALHLGLLGALAALGTLQHGSAAALLRTWEVGVEVFVNQLFERPITTP